MADALPMFSHMPNAEYLHGIRLHFVGNFVVLYEKPSYLTRKMLFHGFPDCSSIVFSFWFWHRQRILRPKAICPGTNFFMINNPAGIDIRKRLQRHLVVLLLPVKPARQCVLNNPGW